jgi:hypothetical protein
MLLSPVSLQQKWEAVPTALVLFWDDRFCVCAGGMPSWGFSLWPGSPSCFPRWCAVAATSPALTSWLCGSTVLGACLRVVCVVPAVELMILISATCNDGSCLFVYFRCCLAGAWAALVGRSYMVTNPDGSKRVISALEDSKETKVRGCLIGALLLPPRPRWAPQTLVPQHPC